MLKQELTDLGASVFVVRDSTEPVTPYRPDDLMPEARGTAPGPLHRTPTLRALPPDKLNLLFGQRLMELAEFLFYRCSEIMERGNRIRNNFVPDITVTLYIDATPGSGRGRLTSGNANIFFVDGSYTRTEMADPEMQRRCVYKMVEGSSDIEAEVAADIAGVFTQRTGLGPVKYGDSATTRAGHSRQSLRRRAQPRRQSRVRRPGRLHRALFHEQPGRLPAAAGRRLRRQAHLRRQELRQHLPRICRLRGAGPGEGLCRFHRHRRAPSNRRLPPDAVPNRRDSL